MNYDRKSITEMRGERKIQIQKLKNCFYFREPQFPRGITLNTFFSTSFYTYKHLSRHKLSFSATFATEFVGAFYLSILFQLLDQTSKKVDYICDLFRSYTIGRLKRSENADDDKERSRGSYVLSLRGSLEVSVFPARALANVHSLIFLS